MNIWAPQEAIAGTGLPKLHPQSHSRTISPTTTTTTTTASMATLFPIATHANFVQPPSAKHNDDTQKQIPSTGNEQRATSNELQQRLLLSANERHRIIEARLSSFVVVVVAVSQVSSECVS